MRSWWGPNAKSETYGPCHKAKLHTIPKVGIAILSKEGVAHWFHVVIRIFSSSLRWVHDQGPTLVSNIYIGYMCLQVEEASM